MEANFDLLTTYQAVGLDKDRVRTSIPLIMFCSCCKEPIRNIGQLRKYVKSHHKMTLEGLVSSEIRVLRQLTLSTEISIDRILIVHQPKRRKR